MAISGSRHGSGEYQPILQTLYETPQQAIQSSSQRHFQWNSTTRWIIVLNVIVLITIAAVAGYLVNNINQQALQASSSFELLTIHVQTNNQSNNQSNSQSNNRPNDQVNSPSCNPQQAQPTTSPEIEPVVPTPAAATPSNFHSYQCGDQSFPPSSRIDQSPLVEHWKLCPLAHRFPYLHVQPDQIPQSLFEHPDMDDPKWQDARQWPDTAYPRIFLMNPVNQTMYQIVVSEAAYNLKPDRWTALATVHEVNDDGDFINAKMWAPAGHPLVNIEYFKTVAHLMTCTDSITNMRQPVEIDYSYYFIRLHCPFAMRPRTPQSVLQQKENEQLNTDSVDQSIKQSNIQSTGRSINDDSAQTADNYDSTTMISQFVDYPRMQTVKFFHPLFHVAVPVRNMTGSWQTASVRQAMITINQTINQIISQTINQTTPAHVLDWLVLYSTHQLPPSTPLSVSMCFSCMPRVDITHCAASLLNGAYLNDIHSHIQYHVALGIQRFTIYDRHALFDDVLRPYIDSGLVDYQPFPLPWRNMVNKQRIAMSRHATHAEQALALESCRVRSHGISTWILYKDTDEWLTFPSNSSFVRQDRTARCYSAAWRESPPSLVRATGAQRYVHMSVGLVEADKTQNRGDPAGVWPSQQSNNQLNNLPSVTSRTSMYSYIHPSFVQPFIEAHRASGDGYWSDVSCPSPLLAWLQSLSDIRLMQSVTHSPDRSKSFAHRDPINHLLPLSPPRSVSSNDEPTERDPVLLSDHLKQKGRWQWFRLCDIAVKGQANLTFVKGENDGSAAPADHKLLFDRFPVDAGHPAVRGPEHPKWIGRPEINGLHMHNFMNAEEVHKTFETDSTTVQMHPYEYMEANDLRPCEEIHFKHFKNFPNQRDQPTEADVIPIEHFHDTWNYIVTNAN